MSLFKSISIYTAISFFTGGISFLLLPVLTQYLSPADYGLLALFNASVNLFSVLIPLGMGYLLGVYIIEKEALFPMILRSYIQITFIISLLLTLVLFFLSLFFKNFTSLPNYVLLALPLVALLVVYFDTCTTYFVYKRTIKQYSFFFLSKFFIEIALILLLVVVFPFSWKGRVASLVISLLFINSVALIYFVKRKIMAKQKSKIKISKELISKGYPLLFMGISIMVINLSDRFFLEQLVGLSETGIYNIASTVAGIMLIIIGASVNVVRTAIFGFYKEKKGIRELVGLFVKYALILILVMVVLLLTTPLIFKYLINERYIEAKQYVPILVFGLFFWGLYNFLVSMPMYFKQNKQIGIISILGIVVNLLLNYFFISSYKTIGAAYSTLCTYAFISVSMLLLILFNPKLKPDVL
ncbi:MAG: oligosaccharide flippase family protein [Flavobacteriales bacterium]|nr:oligosaccharide flippase family protein [Flavobacteriales bacterium]